MHHAVLIVIALGLASTAHASPGNLGSGDRVGFVEVTEAAGLAGFARFSWGFGGDGIVGVAWFDYNNDSLLDLYITNGKDITTPGHDGFPNALFENQGDGTFSDVAVIKGVTNGKGNSGVIAADIDNDGDQDIFLTGDGGMLSYDSVTGLQTIDSGVVLYVNSGYPDFDFSQADNAASGLVNIETTASAAFADVDNDGLIDLFITATGTAPEGCRPPPLCDLNDPTLKRHSSRLYLNRSSAGNVFFRDVTAASGIGAHLGGALATLFTDYNQDGRMDLMVANGAVAVGEPTPVLMWENQGYDFDAMTPVFLDVTTTVGLGAQSAWMGIAAGDFDRNGFIEYFVTNAGVPPHALYNWNQALHVYTDVSDLVGLSGPPPTPASLFGWGASAEDFDLDGRLDLFFAGSFAAQGIIGTPGANPGTLLMNDPPGTRFNDVSDMLGVDLRARHSSGVAAGDYDNDGWVDLVVGMDSYEGDQGHPVLLRNRTEQPHRWLTVRLRADGRKTNRDAIGARVRARLTQDTNWQLREVYGGSSFLSMDSRWQNFGFGVAEPDEQVLVEVDWPDGTAGNWSVHGPFASDQNVSIKQPTVWTKPGSPTAPRPISRGR